MDCGWGFLDILTLVQIPTEQAFWVLQFLLSFWVSNLRVNFLVRHMIRFLKNKVPLHGLQGYHFISLQSVYCLVNAFR